MRKISRSVTLGVAAVAVLAFVGSDSKVAEAAHGFGGFGFHIGGPNVHFDIGNPHGFSNRNQVVYRSARTYYPRHQTRSHLDWHDTSHYDYHPGGYERHGNHLDYRAGHYDFHQDGHFDRHSGGHRGGHRGGGHH